jgi:hypothetical protein
VTEQKFSKHTTQQYNRAMRMASALRSAYSNARCFRWTHKRLLEEIAAIKQEKLTAYWQGYIAGLRKCLLDTLHDNHVLWAFDVGRESGPAFYSELTEEERDLVHAAHGAQGHHYWKDASGNLTPFPFS